MSLVTQIPLDPNISADITPIPAGLASALRGNINNNIALVENKVQTVAAWLEQLQTLLGNGWISGGDVSIGTGRSVNIAVLTAMVDHIVSFGAIEVVGGLDPSVTNYIWLREDGTWYHNSTGVAPTDTVAHGAALLWCTCVTNGTNVISIDQTVRPSFGLALMQGMSPSTIPAGVTMTIPAGYQMIVFAPFTVLGTLIINGSLRILD